MNFLAVGNDELGDSLSLSIICPHCKQSHPIECSSSNPRNDNKSLTLQFYKCGDKTYLAGINNRRINK